MNSVDDDEPALGLFQRAGKFLDGAIFSFSAPVGAVFFGLGCAYVSSYEHATAWSSVKDTATFFAYFLTNPYIGLTIGIPTTFLGGIGMHFKMSAVEKKNAALEDKVKVIPDLEKRIESEQIDSQNLRSEIYRVHQELVGT